MATSAKRKSKTNKKLANSGAGAAATLESVYNELVQLMKRHAPPFRSDLPCVSGSKKGFQLAVPKPVAVPGAYGGKPVHLQMSAAILQKDFVGFYLMCIYMEGPETKNLSPALLKLRKGKSCFHIKKLDDGLRKDIAAVLESGEKNYKERGWL
jgi:hypothetical protein